MDENMFQKVFDLISDYLPSEWSRMVFFAVYTEGSYSMKFFFKLYNSDFVDCFSIPGVPKAKLIKLFMDIDTVLSVNRTELGKDNVWTVLSMIVDDTGFMKTYFEYDDHSEDLVAYEKKWTEKYLK